MRCDHADFVPTGGGALVNPCAGFILPGNGLQLIHNV
jgi:hypothetical protein